MSDTRAHPSFALRAHAAIVLSLLALYSVVWLSGPPWGGGGANIGAGVVGLPLLALGWPWPDLGMAAFDAWGPTRSFSHDGVLIALYEASRLAGAPLNVALHAVAYRAFRRWRDRPAPG